MSALEKLRAYARRDLYKPEPEHLARADAEAQELYDSVRAEVLREAAQRAESHANSAHALCGPCSMAKVIADELRWMAPEAS